MENKDKIFLAFMEKYDKVYDLVANENAREEKRALEARRTELAKLYPARTPPRSYW